MKFCLTILLICFAAMVLPAQTESKIKEDSLLNELYAKKDYQGYFKKINQLGDSAHAKEDMQELLQLSSFLKKEFVNINATDKMALRMACTYLANNIWDLTSHGDDHLELFLIAHENTRSKTLPDSLAWYIENQIAIIYTERDDFEKAAYYSELTERSLRHYNISDKLSRLYTNKGRKLKSEMKVTEAIEVFKRGYVLADSIGYAKGMFANAINLAEVMNEFPENGDPSDYLSKSDSIIDSLVRDHNYIEYKSRIEIERANQKVIAGSIAESIPHYKAGITYLTEFYTNPYKREFAKVYRLLAKAYFELDSIEASRNILHKGFKSLIYNYQEGQDVPYESQIFAENTFVELLSLQARINEALYYTSKEKIYLENEITNINLALYANDIIRQSLIADPSKLISIQNNKRLVENGISTLYELYKITGDNDLLNTARSYFNRSKSILFDEKVQKVQTLSMLSEEDRIKARKLQSKLKELYAVVQEPANDLLALNGEIIYYSEELNKILQSNTSTDVVSDKPENYIEYLVTTKDIFVFSELYGQSRLLQLLEPERVKSLLKRLNDFIRLKNFSTDTTVLSDLFNALIKPVALELPLRIAIIPDEFLGFIPFEILKTGDGRYLIETNIISYKFEYETHQIFGNESNYEFEIICVAPKYPVKESKNGTQTRGSLHHLRYAQIEIDSIRNKFKERAFVVDRFDQSTLEEQISRGRIFHYAGHAIVNDLQSFLALSDKEIESDMLTADEISRLHNPLDLVVLSACETGIGRLLLGEGIQSLGRSFMESGTQSTIISLWNVNDKSTFHIVSKFYDYLKQGLAKDECLRSAKLEYLKSATEEMQHPFFWAAFIPAGNMRALE